MIEFSCPSCHTQYRVADEAAGKKARCKQCAAVIDIPMPASAVVPPASAAPAALPTSGEVLRGVTDHFAYEISQRPDFALVTIRLQPGQKVFAEPSAMASMTPSIRLKAGFKGGLGKTLGRALGGESLIINTFTADGNPGEVTFAAGSPGDAAYYRLDGNSLYLQRGAFMLHSEGVDVTGKWQGAKGFFSGEGLVLLKASGKGDIFF
ncbi:MAG: TIGR00266 family protein, partial [Thermoguttaceae bacterium]|nr:TIGR00266 family protein [Thermoguttaceae bacterium]